MGSLSGPQFMFSKDQAGNDEGNGIAGKIECEPCSDFEEDIMVSKPSKNYAFKREGLIEKIEEIKWPDNLDWIHKLCVDFNQEQEVDVNDDLSRELAFYIQALEGSRQAFVKLQSMSLPFLKPTDYYAEMVKSDAHMVKVKGRLLEEKRQIEEVEERKKAREAKKISKEVQAHKLKERVKQKKADIEMVKKWRKQRKQSGFKGRVDGDSSMSFEDEQASERTEKMRQGVAAWDRSGGKWSKATKKGGDGKKSSREHRNLKFGFGGRKGLKKQNTAESTNDFSVFFKGDLKRKR